MNTLVKSPGSANSNVSGVDNPDMTTNKMNLLQAVNSALDTAMKANPRVVCLGKILANSVASSEPPVTSKKNTVHCAALIPLLRNRA